MIRESSKPWIGSLPGRVDLVGSADAKTDIGCVTRKQRFCDFVILCIRTLSFELSQSAARTTVASDGKMDWMVSSGSYSIFSFPSNTSVQPFAAGNLL